MNPRLLHQFLLAHADERGDQPAVVSGSAVLTHRGLAEAAEVLAGHLRGSGIRRGQAVVVVSEPSIEAVALVCACSIVGAVYVPVDPGAPTERLRGIVHDVDAALVVTGATQPVAEWSGRRCATLGADMVLVAVEGTGANPGAVVQTPEDPGRCDTCYILFTSGTTGRPKGIVMSHRAVLAFWQSLVDHVNPAHDPALRVGSFSSLHFDFTLLDLGLGLGSGGTVVLIDRALFHQPRRFLGAVLDQRVTLMSGVPSLWANVIKFEADRVATLRGSLGAILFAGDSFPIPWLHRLREQLPGVRLINCFGHSESIACTFHDLPDPLPDSWTDLPIAWSSSVGDLMLLTDQGDLIREPGILGEIAVRSAALFDGYHDDPGATSAALVRDPRGPGLPPVFRSGDLGEVGADGLLRFRGRRDNQVKVMGNRVELEELEAHAVRVQGVQSAVAVKCGEEIWLALEGFPAHEGDLVASVAEHLRRHLPRYMMPSRLQVVEGIQRNSNGKADRKRMVEEMTA